MLFFSWSNVRQTTKYITNLDFQLWIYWTMNFSPCHAIISFIQAGFHVGWQVSFCASVLSISFHFNGINYMKMNSQAGEGQWIISPCHESFSSQHFHYICFKTVFLLLLTNLLCHPQHVIAVKYQHCSRTTSRKKYSVNTMQLNSTQHQIRLLAHYITVVLSS